MHKIQNEGAKTYGKSKTDGERDYTKEMDREMCDKQEEQKIQNDECKKKKGEKDKKRDLSNRAREKDG